MSTTEELIKLTDTELEDAYYHTYDVDEDSTPYAYEIVRRVEAGSWSLGDDMSAADAFDEVGGRYSDPTEDPKYWTD